ncbi:MAG: hypothetical protein JO090_15215, partial [Rhizobacter sp.]|nr:hypothetical protein [Rhizobacter sp.]
MAKSAGKQQASGKAKKAPAAKALSLHIGLNDVSAAASAARCERLSAVVKKFDPVLIPHSGCQDNQTSMDGKHNCAFMEELLKVSN